MSCLFLGSPPLPPRLLTRQLCESGCACRPEFSIIRLKNNSIYLNRMNPLFTLGEEFRFHDSSRFRKKARDAKLRFYHSFVPVLMSLAAESCRRSGGVGTPAETLFTMRKGLKEFQLCDSRRLRKKSQDAQDDVTELFDLFDAHFWAWKGM